MSASIQTPAMAFDSFGMFTQVVLHDHGVSGHSISLTAVLDSIFVVGLAPVDIIRRLQWTPRRIPCGHLFNVSGSGLALFAYGLFCPFAIKLTAVGARVFLNRHLMTDLSTTLG